MKKNLLGSLAGIFFMGLFVLPLAAQEKPLVVSAQAETGIVRPLVHTIQIGQNGYRFDYVNEGGQEILRPWFRFEVDAVIKDRHQITFLYQPLTLLSSTRVDVEDGLLIDDVRFVHDTPLDLQYGFDFYRGGYKYRIINSEKTQLALGAALQIRNASIIFDGYQEAAGGGIEEARVVTQDLGPVPVLSFELNKRFGSRFFMEAGLDGFYAPVRYLNLRDVDVVGWLYDASLRVGVDWIENSQVYVGLRALGGGADGTAGERSLWTQSRSEPRYTWNNLNLVSLSLGARLGQ
ncbi:MAG: hypothetical protein D6B26_04225 [Spirochaetaceae bacterium]|nr:MAG: hypothetical protein D6B26_04225 [Spirochaetaceae bacterium]